MPPTVTIYSRPKSDEGLQLASPSLMLKVWFPHSKDCADHRTKTEKPLEGETI